VHGKILDLVLKLVALSWWPFTSKDWLTWTKNKIRSHSFISKQKIITEALIQEEMYSLGETI
jgi:hypothetical protein